VRGLRRRHRRRGLVERLPPRSRRTRLAPATSLLHARPWGAGENSA